MPAQGLCDIIFSFFIGTFVRQAKKECVWLNIQ
nr:MAG TPA: hypothetical protein [Crassvirales sp.]